MWVIGVASAHAVAVYIQYSVSACQPIFVASVVGCRYIYVPEKDKKLPLCATLRTVSASTWTQGLHDIEV